MCFPLSESRILSRGFHLGHEFVTTNNGIGFRCGYVKVEPGHPWHGQGYDDINADVHGSLTFAEPDTPCDNGGEDNGWWVGFDCGHSGDGRDPSLPLDSPAYSSFFGWSGTVIRTQEYVEEECRSLCKRAALAK